MHKKVLLKLNQYQAKNLSDLLRIISCTGIITEKNDRTQVVYPNNGDWLGEIRWMLEPQVEEGESNFRSLPVWAAQKGSFLPIKKYA
jgi:hypothetical protein